MKTNTVGGGGQMTVLKARMGILLRLSRLRILCCYCCGSGQCCQWCGFDPWPQELPHAMSVAKKGVGVGGEKARTILGSRCHLSLATPDLHHMALAFWLNENNKLQVSHCYEDFVTCSQTQS